MAELAQSPQARTGQVVVAPLPGIEQYDTRTLNFDFLALAAIFLVVVAYHLQNPVLLYDVTFGSAFRNSTLQPVIAIGLLVVTILLGGGISALRQNLFMTQALASSRTPTLKRIAFVLLLLYSLYIVLAVVFDFNLFGLFMGIDQSLFLDNLPDDVVRAPFEAHIAATAIFEYLALLSVIALWQPWTRLPVYGRAIRKNAAALGFAIIFLVGIEVLINTLQIQQFLLPRPSVIATTFAEIYPRLVSVGWSTFQNAFWGFVIGCCAGILTGMVAARFTSFSQALLPLAIGINAVPIIALAPIMNNWFGALNPFSKIAIVVVLTYFPAMISTVRGLTSVDHLSLELMTSYAASQWEIFRKLRLPNALPFIFSALKVATTLSMIGAIVSEYFGGSSNGLGYSIRNDAALFKNAEAWSGIVIASLFGILFYLLVSAAERAFMHWHVSFRDN